MHTEQLSSWVHDHTFDAGSRSAERRTQIVTVVTLVAMVVEIVAGWWFNSMALLADGWHMSSHALAIGLSALAYASARQFARDPRFAFGTWKIEVLGGFASAILLAGIAAMMAFASVERLFSPTPIHYAEAIVVAVGGLLVNAACAVILGGVHDHGPAHDHDHDHHHDHKHDLNLRSAYVHVLADAATSVLAIAALAGGWIFGWSWLDPAMGIVGAVLVAVWAKGLIGETAKVLLDREMDHPVVEEIREVVEDPSLPGESRVTDLHVWRVGKSVYSCALTIVTHDVELTAETVRRRLAIHEEIVHSTIEIHLSPEMHDQMD
ncbi:MAG: CDF family Co(II)/Ni(II) efflux transporter DmeF [Proteobacteria bacterium]|nr:CDF family Co(II)/Ni(II) efflux transporter DmeF [Pseudomonadota bacterium]